MRNSTSLHRLVSYGAHWQYDCLSAEAAILGKRARRETETRVSDTAPSKTRMTREALVGLGAERLAEILYACAREDPQLAERLERALAQAPPVRPRPAQAMQGSIERRLAALGETDVYYDWRAAGALGADINAICRDVMEAVLPDDPKAAAELLEQLLDLDESLFESADDSDGEIGDALRATVTHWGHAWAGVPDRDAETVAELVFGAFTDNEYGVFDEVIPAFGEALGADGLAALETRFRAAIEKQPKPGRDSDEDWHRDWSRQALFRGLEDIADIRGDVDGFIAAHQAAGTHLVYAVEVAERLHGAGRSEEALGWFKRSDRKRHPNEGATDLHVAILDALGRGEEARAARWQAFETTLGFDHYRDCQERTPEAEHAKLLDRAIALALGHEDIHCGLDLLIAVGALKEAENLILQQPEKLHDRAYWSLRPAAAALAPDHPAGAILLYRILVEGVLRAGKSKYYRYGIDDLREATLLAERVTDWKGIEDHESFMARLQSEHGRKRSFWAEW